MAKYVVRKNCGKRFIRSNLTKSLLIIIMPCEKIDGVPDASPGAYNNIALAGSIYQSYIFKSLER